MSDPYHPKLESFNFDEQETTAIEVAMATDNPWSWKPPLEHRAAFKSVKNKIRSFHAQRQKQKCCYCRANLHGGGPYMIDREHILPKGNEGYKSYCFALWNLSISCKRCNMEFKRTLDDFVVEPHVGTLTTSAAYHFVHPNFDRWMDHLDMIQEHNPEHSLVIYCIQSGSAKGQFTYDYFQLERLQVNTFDRAQGIAVNYADSDGTAEVRAAARLYNAD